MRYAFDIGSAGQRHDAQGDMNRLFYSEPDQTGTSRTRARSRPRLLRRLVTVMQIPRVAVEVSRFLHHWQECAAHVVLSRKRPMRWESRAAVSALFLGER